MYGNSSTLTYTSLKIMGFLSTSAETRTLVPASQNLSRVLNAVVKSGGRTGKLVFNETSLSSLSL